MIAQAPLIFLAALLVLAGLIYWAVNRLHEGETSALRARLELRDDQIAQFEKKVGSTSPDEVKTRIDLLEAQLRAIGAPRRLTDRQRASLADALRQMPGRVDIAQDMAVAEARPYAGDLTVAFQNGGWTVSTPMVMGPGNPPPHGLGVAVPDPMNLTPKQAVIVHAFRALEIPFDLQKGATGRDYPGEAPMDARILVSQRVL